MAGQGADGPAAARVGPITFKVVRNAFIAICNEMALVVAKTAYSTPVNEGHDFAGAIYDRHGRLVSQGEFDLPTFVGRLKRCGVPLPEGRRSKRPTRSVWTR